MSEKYIESLPKKFTQNVISLCEDEGIRWLNNLPQIINKLEEKWEIKLESHFSNLSYNYVAKCLGKDGVPKVLKIALPLREVEIFNEAKTLQIFGGNGSVKVLKIDKLYQAILLESLIPGKHLKEIYVHDKNKTVDISVDLMNKLYKDSPPQKGFTDVNYWLYKLQKAKQSEFTKDYLTKAYEYFEELNADKEKIKFIHGDLHHENILSVGENDFKSIDPFGINANVGYEIGLFLRVHLKWVKNNNLLKVAIEKFADRFGFTAKEIKQWAYVQHVLSACWDFEDNSDKWQTELELANTWERI